MSSPISISLMMMPVLATKDHLTNQRQDNKAENRSFLIFKGYGVELIDGISKFLSKYFF